MTTVVATKNPLMSRRTALKLGAAIVPVAAGLALPSLATAADSTTVTTTKDGATIELIDAVSQNTGTVYWHERQLRDIVFTRPSGSDYVTWESLVGPAEAARQKSSPSTPTLLPQSLLKTITGNKILTLPAGIFEGANGFVGTNRTMMGVGRGYAAGCRGIVGSGSRSTPGPDGAETVIRMQGTTTNKGTMLIFNGVDNPVASGFSLMGNQTRGDGTFHAGLAFVSCTTAGTISRLYLRGVSPGFANYPPGETFGINVFRSPNVTISDCEIDGRDLAGNRTCSSPIGWNTTENASVYRVYAHHGLTGMLTFWETTNVYTEDYKCFSTSSGTGVLSGSGINHEQSQGQITHLRPQLILNGAKSGAADRTESNGLHISLANVQYDVPANNGFQVIEPLWDANYGSTGMLCFSIRDSYRVTTPGLEGKTQAVRSSPTVVKNGVTMARSDHPTAGWADKDAGQFFAWVH